MRPLTRAEAQARRYGVWAGDPDGLPYKPCRCAESVWTSIGCSSYQCSRKPGHGPDGLYCKQHAKQFEEGK